MPIKSNIPIYIYIFVQLEKYKISKFFKIFQLLCLEPEPLYQSATKCPDGTWIEEIRVKPGYTYGIEFDCTEPGATEKSSTKLAAKGVRMGRNFLTQCLGKPMRGIGFYFNETGGVEAQGYCNYDDHPQFPYGSLCGDRRTAVCGMSITTQGNH